jgi:hypothetical protein
MARATAVPVSTMFRVVHVGFMWRFLESYSL